MFEENIDAEARILAGHDPQWIVPEVCPECGARVDEPVASVAEHPAWGGGMEPLPCEPVPEIY